MGESWETLQEIQILGGPDWFKLGNRDLATHLERTRRLDAGEKLHEITARFCAAWGVEAQVFPMSNDPVPTMVSTQWGEISFQRYFVELACEPVVSGFRFAGVEESRPAPGVISAIEKADLVVICPSNPWVSIDPILAVPGIRSALKDSLVIAVSPIISGRAVRGPAAKMYREMGFNPSAAAVAEHYGDIVDGFIIDEEDADLKEEILDLADHHLQVLITNTWMRNREDRIRVAEDVLKFYEGLMKEV
jgi:LPPG:FO 2-phospho-L-lactate transferase